MYMYVYLVVHVYMYIYKRMNMYIVHVLPSDLLYGETVTNRDRVKG